MVENNIFNQKKMDEYINKYSDKLNINQPDKNPVQDWIDRLNKNSLVQEKQNYFNFRDIILDRILGYKLEDIEFEHAHNDGRPVEFTLLKEHKEYVIIEAKGTKTDLDKRYGSKQSAVEQATNYASVREDTKWAIVTNYEEIRLFNPSSREKSISFKFDELSDEKTLKEFLLTFSKFSLIEMDIPKKLMNETQILEKNFEDEFYKLFSETRLMIIKELQYSGIEKIDAIRYSQLILDRFIFICFAEDINLLPAETIIEHILTPIEHKNLLEYTLWERINELFIFVDKGNPVKNISEFNGGLFNENLQHLKIRDFIEDPEFYIECKKKWKFKENYDEIEKLIINYKDNLNPIYKNLLIMSSFDFKSEVDVNILGHIFENSIGDIEELKDQTRKRRKQDGVYYTPEYITDYICRNTIIPYLSKTGDINTIPDLIEQYSLDIETLDNKVRNIKIIDPACGSGAFLNKSADILLEIHKEIFNKTVDNTLNPWFDSTTERRKILLNNIYGVDLNEESVEITKLAMFLKVAREGIKLPTLNENIKCGNSLVNDINIANEKAFDWKKEFKDIFDNGGFDIVVGNPPYGAKITKKEQNYLNEHIIDYGSETVISFLKVSYDNLLKENGKMGFIIPKAFTYSSKYIPIREYIFDYINIIVDCGKVWKKVKLEQIILTLTKNNPELSYQSSTRQNKIIPKGNILDKKYYNDFNLILNGVNHVDIRLAYKIRKSNKNLNDIVNNTRGIIESKLLSSGNLKVIGGKEIQREGIVGIRGYLNSNENENGIIKNNSVLVQGIVSHILKPTDHIKIISCIPYDRDYIIVDNINQLIVNSNIDCHYVWALLNSKLINWYSYRFIYAKAIRTMRFDNPVTSKIPLPINNSFNTEIINNAIILNKKYQDLKKTKKKFINRLLNHFENIEINKTLRDYEKLTSNKFFKQLEKQKIKVKLQEEEEWEDYFEYSKDSSLKIETEIISLESKLDNLIYKSYNLSEDEIKIIEDSFKCK